MLPIRTKQKLILLGLAAFITIILLSLPKYFREMASANWPTTTGAITRSCLQHAYSGNFDGYIPVVEYQYAVEDHPFTGTQITLHLGKTICMKEYAQSWLDQYPTNKVVLVYYDPTLPSASVLVPGMQSEQRWIFRIAIGYLVACTAAFLVVLYDFRKGGILWAAFAKKYTQHR